MHRYWVMHAALNAFLIQQEHDFVAIWYSDGVHVIDMFGVICFQRLDDFLDRSERAIVLLGVSTPKSIAIPQPTKLNRQDRRLNSIHSAVPADHLVPIFTHLA